MASFIGFLRSHRLAFRLLSLLAGLIALLLAAMLYIALVGVFFDIPGERENIAAKLSASLAREVRLDGSLQFELSAHPKLIVGGVHIANEAGFAGGDFASLREVRLALDLWPLLQLRLQVDELSGSDLNIRLQTDNTGHNNWTFQSQASQKKPPQASTTDNVLNRELHGLLTHLDIEQVSLDNLDVEFIGADSISHFFELQSLTAQIPSGKPIMLTLHGKVEKNYPYKLNLKGGSLGELMHLSKPWPVELSLGFMSSQLSLKGSVSEDTGALKFELDSGNLSEFERLLQIKLPAVGSVRISGGIVYAPKRLTLDNLAGNMGLTTLEGTLDFNDSGTRPKIQGALKLPVLDLGPFMTGKATARQKPRKSLAEMYQEIAKATFNLKELNSADADITLQVGQWLSLPGEAHDAKLQVKLDRGHLLIPLQVTVADVKLSGSASVDASMTPARFDLALGSQDSDLGELADLLFGMDDVKGRLKRFDLHVASQGDSGAELIKSLGVRLDVEHGKFSYGNGAGKRPVEFNLSDLVLEIPAGKTLRGDMHGSLLEKTFSATLSSGSLTSIMQETHTPIDLELQAGSAKAMIHAILQPPSDTGGSEATFDLNAPHSAEIAGWLGLKPGADAPIAIHGKVQTQQDSWHLTDLGLKLGRSDLSADMERTFYKGKSFIKLQLTSEIVDIDELESLLPAPDENAASAAQPAGNVIDIPILPQKISLADADILVRLKRIASNSPLAMRDVHFDGRIRDGMMSASPFSANVEETDFAGTVLLDLRTQQPHSVLELSASSLDIGRILNKLGISKNIDANVDQLRLHLDLHSSRLGKMLSQSELTANFAGGHLTIIDGNTGGKKRIVLNNGELNSVAGSPINLDLRGSLDDIPVSVAIQTAKAVDLINPKLAIPFKFSASAAGTNIKLSGDIDRPFSKKDIVLALDINGSRLDNLNALSHTSLPPWGPWSASGKFHMTSTGYEVSSLLMQVGSSKLKGRGTFDTQVRPPRIDVVLDAPSIQLDDFKFGDWSPEKNKATRHPNPLPGAGTQVSRARAGEGANESLRESFVNEAAEKSNQIQQILSPEALRGQNAFLTVRVDQVVSGQDLLGNGRLDAQIEDGRANIGPVIVNTPGGSASLRIGYEPGDKDVAVNLRAEVKHLDYGILARRIDKKSEMSGSFSLDADVSAHAQNLSEILNNGKGHIDFAIWPKNLKSGLLDLWAVNVLMALLPAVDSSNESKVNCAIGRFELKDGKLSDKTILIDTSRMRVTGKGGVNFSDEDIRLSVQPRAKIPQFMSFAIPLYLSGKFDDFHVGVSPLDVMETVGQIATSIIWVPLERLFGKTIPADGHDLCEAAEFN